MDTQYTVSHEQYAINIAELAIYIVLFPLSIFAAFRNGFGKASGWLYLSIFTAIRIASSAIGILSYKNQGNKTDLIWYSILGGIGISPLLLASKGLLSQVNQSNQSEFRIMALRVLSVPNLIALVVSIVGGNYLGSSDMHKVSQGQEMMQAGIIIFLIVFVVMCAIALMTLVSMNSIPDGERRILFGVLVALPFIFVRILYSILADFLQSSTFTLFGGNVTVQLCMAIIEEAIVAIIYIAVGLTALSPRDDRGPKQQTYPISRA